MVEIVRRRAAVEEDQGRPGEKGRVTLSRLFLLLLLAAVIHMGIQVASAYVEYLSLREAVRAIVVEIATAPHRVEEGNVRILAKARELGLSLAEEQVALRVDGEKVLARVRWQQPIGLWAYTIPVTFEIEESKSLR